MPVIIGSEQKPGTIGAPYYKRKIQCPGHYLIPPTVDIYLREPVPLLKNCSDFVMLKDKRFNLKKTRIARDKWGNKKVDWKKLYELKRKGVVIQPWITSSFAIEHIWDPKGLLCQTCDKRCMEGKGTIDEFSIKRLHQ